MIAYKIMRKMKDGSYASLFCGKRTRYTKGTLYIAELNETKGFKVRKGFHCTSLPHTPHLSTKDRVWVKLDINKVTKYSRPESQGGTWLLSQHMTILEEVSKVQVELLTNNIKLS